MFKMKYPTWTKILTGFGDEEINCALAEFLVLIIEHTEGLFKLAPERQPEDYDETVDGEIDSQLFPNFPILRQRAYYEKECQAEDDKSLKSMCEKNFPTHSALSPGLMVMTCACPRKVVYGISLMTSGESPQMIFDVIMSRFPPDFFIILLSNQMIVWIKSRNCVCHFVFFMQYVVKCTMSWFTCSIRKVFV